MKCGFFFYGVVSRNNSVSVMKINFHFSEKRGEKAKADKNTEEKNNIIVRTCAIYPFHFNGQSFIFIAILLAKQVKMEQKFLTHFNFSLSLSENKYLFAFECMSDILIVIIFYFY